MARTSSAAAGGSRGPRPRRGASRAQDNRPDNPKHWLPDPARKAHAQDLSAYDDPPTPEQDDREQELLERHTPPPIPEPEAPATFMPPAAGSDGATFVLGLLAYAVMFNLVQGGPSQVGAWFRAKFFNKVGAAS